MNTTRRSKTVTAAWRPRCVLSATLVAVLLVEPCDLQPQERIGGIIGGRQERGYLATRIGNGVLLDTGLPGADSSKLVAMVAHANLGVGGRMEFTDADGKVEEYVVHHSFTHPQWDGSHLDSPDLALVVLDRPVTGEGIRPAVIREPAIRCGYRFVSRRIDGQRSFPVCILEIRENSGGAADHILVATSEEGGEAGGACNGSSGGPLFIEDRDEVVAILSGTMSPPGSPSCEIGNRLRMVDLSDAAVLPFIEGVIDACIAEECSPPRYDYRPLLYWVPANRLFRTTFPAPEYGSPENLRYSWFRRPWEATFDPTTRVFSWTPRTEDVGSHLIQVRALDGVLSAVLNVYVQVRDEGVPPLIRPLPPYKVDLNGTLRIALPIDRSAGLPVTCGVIDARDGPSVDPNDCTLTWHPPGPGEFEFELFAEDELGQYREVLKVVVREPGRLWYLRGDFNGDSELDVADPISLATHLFLEQTRPGCLAAGDANEDHALDISDVITLLKWLFRDDGFPYFCRYASHSPFPCEFAPYARCP